MKSKPKNPSSEMLVSLTRELLLPRELFRDEQSMITFVSVHHGHAVYHTRFFYLSSYRLATVVHVQHSNPQAQECLDAEAQRCSGQAQENHPRVFSSLLCPAS